MSFAGGLTDIPKYFNNAKYGSVVSTTIDKYIYITLERRVLGKTVIKYREFEEVDKNSDIKHPIVRTVFEMFDITEPMEVSTIASIVAGNGLGSSSAFTVGLLNAVHRYLGDSPTPYQLAEEACEVEIDILKEPIGKQDQYASAFGGLNYFKFKKSGVSVEPIMIEDWKIHAIDESIKMYHIGTSGPVKDVLSKQVSSFETRMEDLTQLSIISDRLKKVLSSDTENMFDQFGNLLHEQWMIKRTMSGVSNEVIDRLYEDSRKSGVLGGKILGGGGRGFLMLYATKNRDTAFDFMQKQGYQDTPFHFENKGSRIIYEG
jgi:D-glycero-alpha-D-manno-heptose-7-phosphate kinase